MTPGVVGSIPIVHPIFQNPRHIVWGFCFRVLSADVVELVDTLDLGSSAARRESSSLSVRTKQLYQALSGAIRNNLEAPYIGAFLCLSLIRRYQDVSPHIRLASTLGSTSRI